MNEEKPHFHSSEDALGGRGLQLTFENGWCISVQFGYMNYSENRYKIPTPHTSRDAEVAIFNAEGGFDKTRTGNDLVIPGVTPDQLVELIVWTKGQP